MSENDRHGGATPQPEADVLLQALRQGGPAASAARRLLSAVFPDHEAARATVTQALISDLTPSDRPISRWLLEQEIMAHEARGSGATETLYQLVAALARFGQPSDALLLWRARQATPETRSGIDAEQLTRAGLAAVRTALARIAAADVSEAATADAALAWLAEAEAAGAFEDLPAYFAWADERFGLRVTGPT